MTATTWTPDSLEAIAHEVRDLVVEWDEADRWASNCLKSERDDAREVAEERKDIVMQYLSQVMAS